jgi:hypothetical protein
MEKIVDFVQRNRIWVILAIGLINGLFYLIALPPWQHYDEPGHFEYAWLIANRQKLPHEGDFDQNMRLAVGKSLLDSRFFEIANYPTPNLTDPSKPIWIGVEQLVDPPLYYVLAAVPLFILRGAPINIQLFAGRFVSLLFFLVVIYASYELATELTPKRHSLRWALPLFLALLPAFAEIMTAMNNFTAAIGLFSVWIVLSIKLLKHGFNLKLGLFLTAVTIACILTQKVVWIAVIFLPIVLLLSLLPQRFKLFGWIFILLVFLISGVLAINFGDAAFWLRGNDQNFSPRITVNNENNIQYALQSQVYPDQVWGTSYPASNPGFFQLVPINIGDALRGKTITVGAWIWADQVIRGYGPGVNSLSQFQDQWSGFKSLTISPTPVFVASIIQLPEEQERLQVWLRTTSPDNKDIRIYFSGVVLAVGEWPTQTAPDFFDSEGSGGQWGDKQFTNLVRNPQFHQSWPFIKPALLNLITRKISGLHQMQISSIISLFLDYKGTFWYIKDTSARIFRTFWLSFAWGRQMTGSRLLPHPYLILLIFTILGIAGSLITIPRIARDNLNELILLMAVSIAIIVIAYLYGVYIMGGALRYRAFLPVARYIFPAILPLAALLVLGWQGLFSLGMRYLKLPRMSGIILFIVMLVFLNFYMAVNVLNYFHPPIG